MKWRRRIAGGGVVSVVALAACSALAVAVVEAATDVRPHSVSLTADTTGVFGTLNSLVATPAGDILGADDRGLFRWTASGGWSLIVQSTTAPSCSGKKRCYSSPVNSEWGDPSVIELADGTFLVVEPTGSALEGLTGPGQDLSLTPNPITHDRLPRNLSGLRGSTPDVPRGV